MSLGSQMRRFQQKTAVFRKAIFGTALDSDGEEKEVTADYNQGEIPALPGYYSPIKDRQQTEEAGFIEMHDCAFRVIKENAPKFTPAIDKHLLIREGETEILLRIDEIAGTHPLSQEWVLGCKAAN